ncbi:MAG TPA: LssY C-terminal domain-containing protein [Bryobacteraceae bacterium]|nr:LssY C-terminal domain-containing protein [Bryobacteraceae bacterium]
MRPRLFRAAAICLAAAAAGCAFALPVPGGTEIQIRLKTKISTQTAREKDPVEAVVIEPVMAGGQFAIPAGAAVRGSVEKTTASKPDQRAVLVLNFDEIEINGAKLKLQAQVGAIDNARESVDDQGQISGLLSSETITGELDTGLNKLASRYSGLADVLAAAKNAVLKPADTDITYDAGTELTLKLKAALDLAAAGGPGPAGNVGAIPNDAALAALVAREPFQTVAQAPPKPSDVTNIILIGNEAAVQKAFMDAGWSTAAGLNAKAKFETFRALAEARGYSEAPVSILLLEGKPPDQVFEKLNNTFAQRHHLRVWRRPATFEGNAVWAVAATHDTGISFSEKDRTFIHKIDSQIDRERAKVVNDLIFSGHVMGVELVDRPQVPQHGQNATGDSLETDGKVAVLLLK